MISGKKGQVFLLAAIIIGITLISVSIKYNTVVEYPLVTDYKEISDNYLTEAPKIINYARYNNFEEKDQLESFTKAYREQAIKKDPNFGIFYAFRDELGKVHLVNTLNNRVLTIVVREDCGLDNCPIIANQEIYGKISSDASVCLAGSGCVSTEIPVENFGGVYINNIDLDILKSSTLQICLTPPATSEEDPTDCTAQIGGALTVLTSSEKLDDTTLKYFGLESGKRVDVIVEEYK